MKKLCWMLSGILLMITVAKGQRQIPIASPDGKLKLLLSIGKQISYSMQHAGDVLVDNARLSMTLAGGEVWGVNPVVKKISRSEKNETIPYHFGTSATLQNQYKEVSIEFKGDWGLVFRLYNEGAAYRFVNRREAGFNIMGEEVGLNFPEDFQTFTNYTSGSKDKPAPKEKQLETAFENFYDVVPLSKIDSRRLIVLPLVIDAGKDKKVIITESDLESYPGLYLNRVEGANKLSSYFAAYPDAKHQGGGRNIQMLVDKRFDYIAKVTGKRNFPWRVFVVTTRDQDMLGSELVYKLAEPSRIKDVSWIEPGLAMWDWWHDRNMTHVSFKTGVNTETYKYYIDFAAANNMKYVVVDEGWSDRKKVDLFAVVPEMNIKEIVDYGKRKNIGILLWAGYWPLDRDMERAFKHYAEIGVKGFKVDYLNRDDQEMVDFVYRSSATAAKYQMILDFHGIYKPTGIQRTFPNVLNFEGVMGLETSKFSATTDMVDNDVTIPFIRMLAGPMDYTPGAMRNAAKGNFRVIGNQPMSHGTRCRQLAIYVVYKAPLQMISDNPSEYIKEPESFDFIKTVPVSWDETITINGKLREHLALARRSGPDWWVAGMTNWNERTMEMDLDFLPAGNYEMLLFTDGINADRNGGDYNREIRNIKSGEKLKVKLMPGGGFAMKLRKI
ncbi:glycoside hydrolase family 97 protein [Niabella hibiscisoli]|uniref:glycoside hydrolase family 97 protein n=1 Tax=Niabella hibiscisoli TaxID=1825928 RepID=UPI001F0F4607|nr:glycoside hydrolase family 97 protein [Niabella hibiscisoli]MCH5719078.1 glycoside hydrolase family 97 protein [Niabella hibiscisoli]